MSRPVRASITRVVAVMILLGALLSLCACFPPGPGPGMRGPGPVPFLPPHP